MTDPQPHCLVEREGGVVVVTLNRPERRNAFSPEMLALMNDAWDLIDSDPDVRVAILTGAGGTFCAGADLKAMAGGDQSDPRWRERFDEDADLAWKALRRSGRFIVTTTTPPSRSTRQWGCWLMGILLVSEPGKREARAARRSRAESGWGGLCPPRDPPGCSRD